MRLNLKKKKLKELNKTQPEHLELTQTKYINGGRISSHSVSVAPPSEDTFNPSKLSQ